MEAALEGALAARARGDGNGNKGKPKRSKKEKEAMAKAKASKSGGFQSMGPFARARARLLGLLGLDRDGG